jgi:hypothetical protein
MVMHDDVLLAHLDRIQRHMLQGQQHVRGQHTDLLLRDCAEVVCTKLSVFHQQWH